MYGYEGEEGEYKAEEVGRGVKSYLMNRDRILDKWMMIT